MEEKVFGKPALKTYSRAKNKRGLSDDGKIWQEALQVQGKLSSPDNIESASEKGTGKRERIKSSSSETGSLKKLKLGRKKKAILQVKLERKTSVNKLSPLHDSYEDDVLFGEGLQPVKTRQKSKARNPQTGTLKQKSGAKGRLKRSSVSNGKPQDQLEVLLPEKNTSETIEESPANKLKTPYGKHASVSVAESRVPLGSKQRSEDKVSDWLARSDNCRSHDDSSKEVWRGEQQLTGDEIRNKLFPDEFFLNLNCVLQKPQSTTVSKQVKVRQNEFLSKLAQKNMDKQLVGGPEDAAIESFTNNFNEESEDVTFIYSNTSPGLQTDTQTQSGTQKLTRTSYTSTGASRFTETESSGQTGALIETGTYSFHTSTGASQFKETETQSSGQTGTGTQTLSLPNSTGNSKFTSTGTQSHDQTGVTKSSNHHTDTCVSSGANINSFPRNTSARASSAHRKNSMEIKDQFKLKTTEREQTFACKGYNVQKYLCSTMRRSKSLNSHDFPSELSAVTDCLKTQQQEEKTPRKKAEEFKVPSSPTKCATHIGMRRGTLQPKNSTKLFTTGFVEIEDVIPQMSTINCEQNSKSTGIEDDLRPKQRQQNIKTSTPNKVNSEGQVFQFEIDISSVKMDSDDDLHFNESREVNTEECIHLSDTLIDTQQDRMIQDIIEDPKTSQETGMDGVADGKVIDASTVDKARKLARTEASTVENFAIETRSKGKVEMEKTRPASKKSRSGNRRVPKTIKQTKFGSLKKCLQKQCGRRRISSAVSGTLLQSGYSRRNSSCALSRNTNDNKSKGKSVAEKKKSDTVIDSDKSQVDNIVKSVYDIDSSYINTSNVPLANDVFGIDESAKNISVPEYKKLAKNTNFSFKRPERKKAVLVPKQQTNKRKSSEISFNPKVALKFNSLSYSTLASESPGSLFSTYKQNCRIIPQSRPLDVDRNSYSYSNLASNNLESLFHTKRHNNKSKSVCPEPQRGITVPVCTLMDEDFNCPRVKKPFVMYKTTNTRSFQEVLHTVQIDSLMM